MRLFEASQFVLATLVVASIAAAFVHDKKRNIFYYGLSTSPGVETFLGIPFGASTAGSNRFAPPQPFSAPPGHIFNATKAGPACPQGKTSISAPEAPVLDINEDCLNLNIARPAGSHKALLPVMVWIYGGGLNTGSANDGYSKPDGMIFESMENGLPVVFVAINYRLNVFGFATSESLRGSKSLNNGLRDQRLALDWVQENIEAFGGDPNKVTIFGQSSGGLSVAMQVLAYGGTRPVPFHSAIMESTALEPGMSSNISFNATAAIAVMAGCLNGSASNFAPGSPSQSPAVIDCLRALPMETLLNYSSAFIDETSDVNDGDIFLPTVDQDFLPSLASELVSSGRFPEMPFIIGWEDNDATLFTPMDIITSDDTKAFIELYYPYLDPSSISALLDLYPSTDFQADTAANLSSEFYRSAEIFRDIYFVCPSFFFGRAMAEKYASNVQCTPEPLPVYYFDGNQSLIESLFNALGIPGLGVTHTSELAYVFGNVSLINYTSFGLPGPAFAPTPEDYVLEKQVPRSWTTFAWTDSPSLEGKNTLPGWTTAYPDLEKDGNGDVYVLGGGKEGMAGSNGENNAQIYREKLAVRCAFLNDPAVIEQLKY